MTFAKLAWMAERAATRQPPRKLREFCGDYYAPYYLLFYLVSAWMRTGTRVELGVEKGRGCLAMLLGCRPRAQVVGIDHTRFSETDYLRVKYPNFIFLERPSLPPPEGVLDGEGICLLHVDTEHSESMAREEFNAYRPHLLPGAVVCFDDLHAQEDQVMHYFFSLPYPKLQDDRLHPSCGFGALVYEPE